MTEKDQKEKKTKEVEELTERYSLKKPHISEKATDLAKDGFYVFKVEKDANKREVKKEVGERYKVDVVGVRMVNVPSKKRRMGKTEGTKKGYKKAIVKIAKGQSIDLTL